MTRKKKTLTRKRRALRHCLWAAALLLLYIISVDYHFTPESASQTAARKAAIEPVELLIEYQPSPWVRLRLSRNEDAMQFLRLTFSPLRGWVGGTPGASLAQRYGNGSSSVNNYTVHEGGKENRHIATYWYGFLPQEATRLELVSRPADDPPTAGPGGTVSFNQKDFYWNDELNCWFFIVESPYDANAFITNANVWSGSSLLAENVRPDISTSSTT